MATQKPISTISYNTEAFLKEKLETWYKAHIIQAYMYIKHKGEDGDKDHIHLRIEPNKKLDPMDLQDQLREYEIGKDKPLGCRPFRSSVEEDWIMYAVHDKDYLKIKYAGGEKGEKLEYQWTSIVANENYDVEIAYIRAKQKLEHTTSNLAHKIQQGADPLLLIAQGENPFVVNQLMRAYFTNDYTRLAQTYDDICQELERANEQIKLLKKAIKEYGLTIVSDENGHVKLDK